MSHCLGPHSPEKLHTCYKNTHLRALNLKCQPCCQRALTTRDAPGIVRLLFTRSYFKMSKGFCMSYEHDRLLRQQASTVGGLSLTNGIPSPMRTSSQRSQVLGISPRHQNLGEKPPFSPRQTSWLPTAKARLLGQVRNQIPQPKIRGLQRKTLALDKQAWSEQKASLPARLRHRTTTARLILYFLMQHPIHTKAFGEASQLFSGVNKNETTATALLVQG